MGIRSFSANVFHGQMERSTELPGRREGEGGCYSLFSGSEVSKLNKNPIGSHPLTKSSNSIAV